MHDWNRFRTWTHSHWDVCLDIVRMYLGVGLFIKGLFFMSHLDELYRLIAQSGYGWLAPVVLAHYVIMAHLVGGFMLAIGLLTRLAALFQLPILLGAVFLVHGPSILSLSGRQDFEFSTLVLFLVLIVFAFGAGRWSTDYYLDRRLAAQEGKVAWDI